MKGKHERLPASTLDKQAAAARAREIVMQKERELGFEPVDRELDKLGYDIESRVSRYWAPSILGSQRADIRADTVTVTKNEILYSLNKPEDFILAIVAFNDDGSHGVHYVRRPFHDKGVTTDFAGATVNFPLAQLIVQAAAHPSRRYDFQDTNKTHRGRAATGSD